MDTPPVTLQTQFFSQTALTLCAAVVLLYDHIITFDIEYRRIWRRPWRKASAMFLLNRYVAFFTIPATIYTDFPPVSTPKACKHFTLYRQIAIGIMQLIVAVNQLLRVYALYGLDRRIGAGVALAAGAVVATGVWSITVQKASDAAAGCHPMISSETANRLAIAWVSLFAYDVLIFVLMLIKAAKDRARLALAQRGRLVTIIYRDGAVYFAVMVCAQCANVISFYTFPPALKGVLSTLASSISVTMMSRCILNLHEYDALLHGVTDGATGEGFEMSLMSSPAPISGASDSTEAGTWAGSSSRIGDTSVP